MPDVTAREAAELLGVSERTARRHIKAGKIAARKPAPNRYAIDSALLPAAPLPRKGLAGQIAQLSAQVAAATKRLTEMQAEIDKLKAAPSPYRSSYAVPPFADVNLDLPTMTKHDAYADMTAPAPRRASPPQADMSAYLSASIPRRELPPPPLADLAPVTGRRVGWVRVRVFARVHNVADGTVISQLTIYHLEHEAIATHARDGRRERWLTPAQQDKLVAFWAGNGTPYQRCTECATGHSRSSGDDFAELDRELALD